MIDLDYKNAIDFGHCETMQEAREKLSTLTNLLNEAIRIRQETKKDILEECAVWKGEKMHKLSWENKLVRLAELTDSTESTGLWQEADMAVHLIKNKQDQVMEDLLSLKKIFDVTPR